MTTAVQETKAPKKEKLEGLVGPVKLAKVKLAQLRMSIKDILGKDPKPLSVETMVTMLNEYFVNNFKPDQLLACEDGCEGLSDAELECCPFCGAVDESAEDMQKQTTEAKPKKAKVAAAAAAAVEPETNGKLTLLAGGNGIVHSDKDLDVAIERIRQLKATAAVSVYDLGEYIYSHVYSSKLWTLRTDEKGKQSHKSFAHFIKAEVGMADSFVYQAMEVSQSFTREQALQIGGTHLRYLVGAPKEDRDQLLEQVKSEGLTVKETKRLVQEVRKNKGVEVQNNRGGNAPKSPGRAGAPKEVTSIGITLSNKKLRFGLHQRGNEEKPVKRFADKPVLRIPGSNGVVLTLALVENSKGEWEAVGMAKRED